MIGKVLGLVGAAVFVAAAVVEMTERLVRKRGAEQGETDGAPDGQDEERTAGSAAQPGAAGESGGHGN